MSHPAITEQLEAPEEARKAGRRKMAWARQHMPIMRSIGEEFAAETPLAGETVAMAMHVEAKTAVQPVMATSAPASASTSVSTAVLASTCIAIATVSPASGVSAANSSPTDRMMGMCCRAHAIFRRPASRAWSGVSSCSVIVGWLIPVPRGDGGKTLPQRGGEVPLRDREKISRGPSNRSLPR